MTTTLPDPASNLAEEQQVVQSLLALLQREQTRLMATGIDGLPEMTVEKNTLINRMAVLGRARYAALAAVAHDADENGMRAWLEQGPHHAAQRLWTDLRTQAEAARELNRTNGLLIGKRLAHNQAALNVLQGSAAGGNFYGPDGQSTSRSSNHRLIVG
ncbi:MAG TPA: flagellar protein FlgN [Burkholderiaceae bacterium]|nr:flagellar protein FlgN [Burkholderiaceae bacterium]